MPRLQPAIASPRRPGLRFGLEQYPKDPDILNLAAKFEQARGDNGRAVDYYKASIDASPAPDPGAELATELSRPVPAAYTQLPGSPRAAPDLATLLAPGTEAAAGTLRTDAVSLFSALSAELWLHRWRAGADEPGCGSSYRPGLSAKPGGAVVYDEPASRCARAFDALRAPACVITFPRPPWTSRCLRTQPRCPGSWSPTHSDPGALILTPAVYQQQQIARATAAGAGPDPAEARSPTGQFRSHRVGAAGQATAGPRQNRGGRGRGGRGRRTPRSTPPSIPPPARCTAPTCLTGRRRPVAVQLGSTPPVQQPAIACKSPTCCRPRATCRTRGPGRPTPCIPIVAAANAAAIRRRQSNPPGNGREPAARRGDHHFLDRYRAIQRRTPGGAAFRGQHPGGRDHGTGAAIGRKLQPAVSATEHARDSVPRHQPECSCAARAPPRANRRSVRLRRRHQTSRSRSRRG